MPFLLGYLVPCLDINQNFEGLQFSGKETRFSFDFKYSYGVLVARFFTFLDSSITHGFANEITAKIITYRFVNVILSFATSEILQKVSMKTN